MVGWPRCPLHPLAGRWIIVPRFEEQPTGLFLLLLLLLLLFVGSFLFAFSCGLRSDPRSELAAVVPILSLVEVQFRIRSEVEGWVCLHTGCSRAVFIRPIGGGCHIHSHFSGPGLCFLVFFFFLGMGMDASGHDTTFTNYIMNTEGLQVGLMAALGPEETQSEPLDSFGTLLFRTRKQNRQIWEEYKSLKFTHCRGKFTRRAITESTVTEVR